MLVPLVLAVIAISLYPGLITDRGEASVERSVGAIGGRGRRRRAMTFTAPEIDYAALSPIIALTGGLVVVLLAGLVGPRGNRWLSSALTLTTFGAAAGLAIWQWGERESTSSRARFGSTSWRLPSA